MLDELFFAHSWFGILNLSFITYFFWRCIYCMCHLSTLWAIRDVSSWQLKWQNGYVRRHETIPSGSPFRPLWVWCVPFDCHSLDVKRKYLPSTFRLWFFFVRFPFSAAALFCFHEHFLIDLPLFGCRFCCRCRLHRGHGQLAAKTTASSLSPTVISSNFLSFIYYYYYFFFSFWNTHAHGSPSLSVWVWGVSEEKAINFVIFSMQIVLSAFGANDLVEMVPSSIWHPAGQADAPGFSSFPASQRPCHAIRCTRSWLLCRILFAWLSPPSPGNLCLTVANIWSIIFWSSPLRKTLSPFSSRAVTAY